MLALIPILITVLLSWRTKNIFFSLIIGIFSGALIYSHGHLFNAFIAFIDVFATNAMDNMNILIYVSFLGMFIYLVNKSRVAAILATKALKKVKTKKHATILTSLLGVVLFIDDYFNCLTVNTAMKPITDKHKISREKLAYLVDATASPMCVLTPISSWAGLVGASLPALSSLNGFELYISTIPFNLYPIMTILFIIILALLNFDFGRMKVLEERAQLRTDISESLDISGVKAKISDLVIPIIILVLSTLSLMLYSGGLFSGNSLIEAFMNCDAVTSLAMGCAFTVVIMALLYIPRKIVTKAEFLDGVTEGFEFMSTALLMLLLAWSFSTICGSDYLNFTGFVSDLILNNDISFILLPFILFILCFGVTLATGVSWAAIGLMIPIVVTLFGDNMTPLMVLSTAAVISGGAAGDHIGPLSDTTILSAKISGADFMQHVVSQFQYGIIVFLICSIGYLVAGLTGHYLLGFGLCAIMIPLTLIGIKKHITRKE